MVVLGLPRGGVPVAYEVAQALGASLDVLIVRKLGVPGQEELAMGAIGPGGAILLNDRVMRQFDVDPATLRRVADRERAELERRSQAYRAGRGPLDVSGRMVIVVDDGVATGASLGVALRALDSMHPAEVMVAVPVAPVSVPALLQGLAHSVVVAVTPEPFDAVGAAYDDFTQVDDAEVRRLLADPSP